MLFRSAHATVPDNAGKMPRDEAIDPFGAAAYFTPFPVRNLAEGIRNAGVPATLSYSAGAYVCNDLYYRLMREFEGSKTRVLFVHVPRAEGVAEYAEMGKAVSAALSEILLSEAIAENVKK